MYGVPAYFLAKVSSEFPMFLSLPTLMSCIAYFALNLNLSDGGAHFFIFLFIAFSLYVAGGGMGLLIGSAVSNKQVAVSLTPIVIIPFMLFAGFFVNQDNIPKFLLPFEYISLFKYGMQAMMNVRSFNSRTNTP
jgi:ABC-type multidrug transport system permease subunit